ncbi:MAG TPA: putative baseplate assembly protein [Thermoanaerobaculia bacterium]|nr:putative baseplate assembly protein [Thermoanaerobaculia bacterium]
MPLSAPNLDDRTFEDIVADALRLVPRYAPEWTDHHESDPGVTFVQLFAWMTEMTLYRLNQVPERHYIKFLELLGIELEPALPARAELTFALARQDVEVVLVPRGTQIASAEGGGEPVVFETDEALVALGASLAAVQVFDGFGYTVETTKNDAPGQWLHPFGSNAREGSALVLGFDSPLPFTARQVNLAFFVDPATTAREGLACGGDALPPPPSKLVWEFWDKKLWQPLSLDKDETRAFTRSGHVYLRGPGTRVKKDRLGGVVDRELYWLRCRLVKSGYDRAPRLVAVLTNTVRATQALTVRDEVLGAGDGRPGQRFTLANAPVVARDRELETPGAGGRPATLKSLRLEVNESGSEERFEVWQEVDDFLASGPDDPHYTLNRTTGEVRFGDGRRGRIPVASARPNIVAREYRFGGGRRGNVGAGALSQILSFVDGVASVTNRRPAEGGADEETLEEAKLRAPAELKAKGRAVTAGDFELLAEQAPGTRVRRAKALPLAHPRFPGARIPGSVTVIVVPDVPGPKPVPSEATLAAVCAHLDCHRLLTTEVHVVPPRYHEVVVEADVVVRPEADLAEVKRALEEKLAAHFHPLTGGPLGTGWPFGGDLFYSQVYRVLLDVPGVDRIRDNQLFLWLDGERQELCRDVAVPPGELLFSGEHQIRVTYTEEE